MTGYFPVPKTTQWWEPSPGTLNPWYQQITWPATEAWSEPRPQEIGWVSTPQVGITCEHCYCTTDEAYRTAHMLKAVPHDVCCRCGRRRRSKAGR